MRCAICHADDGTLEACLLCRTRGHAECFLELGRCPTLGCRMVAVALPRAPGCLPLVIGVVLMLWHLSCW